MFMWDIFNLVIMKVEMYQPTQLIWLDLRYPIPICHFPLV